MFHQKFKIAWLALPLLVVILVGCFLIKPLENLIKEIGGFTLMTIGIVSLALLFRNTTLRKLLLILSYVYLAFFAFVKLSFYMQYGVGISASALFVIFETNSGEASDYLSNYFSLQAILLLVVLLLPVFFLLKMNKVNVSSSATKSKTKNILRIALLLGIAVASIFIIRKKFSTQNIPYATITTWKDYKIAKQQLKDKLAQPISPVFKDVTAKETPQTYVVVIGESSSRRHMQLYGYPRETNPKLTQIKNELVVMDSIITPHVHTITAIEKILTLANFENAKPAQNGSIIQLANQAGFTTYWLSNQKPVGLYESIPTILGSAAKHTKFIATDDYNYQIYDGSLLPELDTILAQKDISKKIIFIHLIGTHLKYKKRYPKAFKVFNDTPANLKYTHAKAIAQTNAYDNAMRYNDHVLFEIIERLRTENTRSFMVYFSDHGDEVYDTIDFLGHNEYHGTSPMYEIPLLFWFSQAYTSKANFKDYTHRKYSLEDFPHTFAQLSGIRFSKFDATKNVLDSTFVERPRMIKDNVDYDQK